MIVVLGELGGQDEYSLVDALKEKRVTKPVVAWVSGTCAKLFTSEVQFGHAGAKSGGQSESAQVCWLTFPPSPPPPPPPTPGAFPPTRGRLC